MNQTFEEAVKNLKSKNYEAQIEAIQTIVVLEDRRAIPHLYEALGSAGFLVIFDVIFALHSLGVEIVPVLLRALKEGNSELRNQAAWWLGKLEIEQAIPDLVNILISPENEGYGMADLGLTFLGDKAVPDLLNLLHHPDPAARVKIINCLAAIGDDRSIGPLIACLDDPDAEVRKAVLLILWVKRIRQGLPEIEQLAASDPDEDVRFGAATLAEQIKTDQWVKLF